MPVELWWNCAGEPEQCHLGRCTRRGDGEVVPVVIDRRQVVAALPGYELGEQLGSGAFGLVLAGRHRDLDRYVAVKIVPSGQSEAAVARFKAEARLLAQLNHPHIVNVYDYVEYDEL